jgi:hypothetical protein
MTNDEGNIMTHAAKKAAAPKPDETEQPAETSGKLTTKFDHQVDQRESGDVHEYTFADGTSAKVWHGPDKDQYSVLVRDARGRGLSSGLSENVTVDQVNELVESAGQKAVDEVKKSNQVN